MSHTLTLVQKVQLIEKVYFLTFKSEDEIDFWPGQFMSLEIYPKTFRAYSVCYVGKSLPPFIEGGSLVVEEKNYFVSFMISTKPGGEASAFFDNIKIDTTLNAVGPSGKFALLPNSKHSVFIATGTGLSPFIGMIDLLLKSDKENTIIIFFGCWKMSDNFASRFITNPRVKLIIVAEDLEDTPQSDSIKLGRVTTAVPLILSDLNKYDYYLCGHPAMVQAMEDVLIDHAVNSGQIVTEKFGIIKK